MIFKRGRAPKKIKTHTPPAFVNDVLVVAAVVEMPSFLCRFKSGLKIHAVLVFAFIIESVIFMARKAKRKQFDAG